jgi:hypothetical protein
VIGIRKLPTKVGTAERRRPTLRFHSMRSDLAIRSWRRTNSV